MKKKNQDPQADNEPILIEKGNHKYKDLIKEYKEGQKEYKEGQICVFFDIEPLTKDFQSALDERIQLAIKHLKNLRKKHFGKNEDEPWEIEICKCDSCNCPVVLLKGDGLDSIIVNEGVEAGTVSPTGKVGDEYSLNFYKKFPIHRMNKIGLEKNLKNEIGEKKDRIVVAVLDTGLDTNLIDDRYLWKNPDQSTETACYKDAKSGWNFVENCSHYHDDDEGKHGTIVSQYIINEFTNSSSINSVQIMPLKTHDASGRGDLFGSLCAIYFAMVKGANIINASWGLYCYYGDPFRLMSLLIKKKLQEQGILFITAAGNRDADEEIVAKEIYKDRYPKRKEPTDEQLRNLAIHHFYPAHLSLERPEDVNGNSVITVTTTDGKEVCGTQNHSNQFVDLGIEADEVTANKDMKFEVPFPCKPPNDKPPYNQISGSSFATAIATGVISAYCPKELFKANLNKSQFISCLKGSSAILLESNDNLGEQIKDGLYIKKRPRSVSELL